MNRTRFAPTPSGFLHLGNIFNLLIVQIFSEIFSADILLRIDDGDKARVRKEYVEDIFRILDILEIQPKLGPRNFEEWLTKYSAEEHTQEIRKFFHLLTEKGLPQYVCKCSRTEIGSERKCVNRCASQNYGYVPGEFAIRAIYTLDDHPVIWRRDDLPSYHLSSIYDDELWKITHILRGDDLRVSTNFQKWIARFVPNSYFESAMVMHHPLKTDGMGIKFSKSVLNQGQPLSITSDQISVLHKEAEAWISKAVSEGGLEPPSPFGH